MFWHRIIKSWNFLKQMSVLVIVACMANVSVYGATEQKQKKPNILFIAIDDLNDWTDMLEGNAQARTPQMDKFASKGIVFTNAHCAARVVAHHDLPS